MRTQPANMTSIHDRLAKAGDCSARFLWGATATVSLGELPCGTSLGGRLEELSARSVLVATQDQFAAALALIELDGVARRLVICTPDFPSEQLPVIIAKAGVEAIVSDRHRHESPVG